MKQIITSLALIFICTIGLQAQENNKDNKRKPGFSHEKFQARQRAFITEHARLTPEEAEKFFPLFFELQKSKWDINKEARSKFRKKKGEKLNEQECNDLIHEFADVKIKVAQLEKEYIEKYLKVIPAKKVMDIQRAEDMFQREILKNMSQHGAKRNNERRQQ